MKNFITTAKHIKFMVSKFSRQWKWTIFQSNEINQIQNGTETSFKCENTLQKWKIIPKKLNLATFTILTPDYLMCDVFVGVTLFIGLSHATVVLPKYYVKVINLLNTPSVECRSHCELIHSFLFICLNGLF